MQIVRLVRILALAAGAFPLSAQAPAPAAPAFEIASVKRNPAGGDSSSWNSRGGYLDMKHQTLRKLIAIAYGVKDETNVSGGPPWLATDHFDIVAKAAGPDQDPELLLMLQTLLAERFQLVVHPDSKGRSGFALVVPKSGLTLAPDPSEGKAIWNSHRGQIVAQRVPIGKLAESLTVLLGTPVVDATGAPGVYSFTLDWDPNAPAPDALFEALRPLGIRVENRKLPVQAIVVEKAEQPAEN